MGKPYPDAERAGAVVGHLTPTTETGYCEGAITFDVPEMERWHTGPRWHVESWDPLTISPSLLCQCGDHGYIRAGRWVAA